VVREAISLFLTLALGICLVALIIFAPRAFLSSAPLAGVGAKQSVGLTDLLSYLNTVREYALGLLHGDLGTDNRGRAVSLELLPAARRTLELMAVSLAAALPIGLAWGALLAGVRHSLARAMLFGLNTLLNSLPSFVIMMLTIEAVATLTLRTGRQLTYVQGYGLDRHLILPAGVLALRGAAYMARAIQVAQEEILRQDWIRAARAKGLGGMSLWRRHVLPSLRLPILGSLLGMLRVIISGLVIVDYLYNWNGLGTSLLKATGAITARGANDRLATGAAVLLVCLFVGVDALGRLALRHADPRMHGRAGD
jgi:ABC-type dipeptide/oligopeptide/nickel transport system permease component